jgi:hypothetical protein
VRFPKGKKLKETFTYKVDDEGNSIKPDKAVELRAKRRKQDRSVEVTEEEVQVDISRAEIRYGVSFWLFFQCYLLLSSLATCMSTMV